MTYRERVDELVGAVGKLIAHRVCPSIEQELDKMEGAYDALLATKDEKCHVCDWWHHHNQSMAYCPECGRPFDAPKVEPPTQNECTHPRVDGLGHCYVCGVLVEKQKPIEPLPARNAYIPAEGKQTLVWNKINEMIARLNAHEEKT
jgi:methionyl-tRNA synthetase